MAADTSNTGQSGLLIDELAALCEAALRVSGYEWHVRAPLIEAAAALTRYARSQRRLGLSVLLADSKFCERAWTAERERLIDWGTTVVCHDWEQFCSSVMKLQAFAGAIGTSYQSMAALKCAAAIVGRIEARERKPLVSALIVRDVKTIGLQDPRWATLSVVHVRPRPIERQAYAGNG